MYQLNPAIVLCQKQFNVCVCIHNVCVSTMYRQKVFKIQRKGDEKNKRSEDEVRGEEDI